MKKNPDEKRCRRLRGLGFDYASKEKVEVQKCNLCGAEKFVIIAHQDRYGFNASAYGCLGCGLVFLSPRMTGREYEKFYAETYRPLVSAFHGRRIDSETIQVEQGVYALNLAGFLSDYVKQQKHRTLLDVGGSTGVVSRVLSQKFGLSATILDPSPLELDRAKAYGLKTISGLIENLKSEGTCYDIVVMCQTVDHLLDISGALYMVNKLLSNNGLFFVDFVDFRAAYLRERSVEAAIKIDHPFYLTESVMQNYLARCGFEVLKTDYAADHLHVGYICRKMVPDSACVPDHNAVEGLWREIRLIQNLPQACFHE